jgi:hypothetical protein
MKKRPLLLGGILAFTLLAGCQTRDEAKKQPEQAKASGEYTRSTPTGSWISKRVKKSETKTSESDSAQAQEAMRQLQRQGNRTPKDSGN